MQNSYVPITVNFFDAVYASVKALLYRQYFDVDAGKLTEPIIASKRCTAVSLLNKAIGHGGGHTLNPTVGTYWLFEYLPGIKTTLFRSEGKIIVSEKVSRELVIEIAEKCLEEYKMRNAQLSLF